MERRSQNSLSEAKLPELVASLISDLQLHHPHLKKSLSLDLRTIFHRMKNEGTSFVTQALPRIGKAIYRSLEEGKLEVIPGFTLMRGTILPRLFGGLLTCVYEDDGRLRQDFESSYLVDLIQICFLFYKLELPYVPEKERKVIQIFVETERELESLALEENDEVLADAADLAYKVLRDFDPFDILPKHGPGAVATGEKGTQKWEFKRKYNNLHKVYPYYDYFVPSRSSLLASIPWYRGLEQLESGTARVVLVPKDSRGPRLISMEPLEYQFIQQGISKALVKHLETRSGHTRGFVNFTDQSINRNLALHNSVTRSYATLDMKEASDRVSVKLVKSIFRHLPDFLSAILASRTDSTELPSGQIIHLNKFAPMGSALCFPVEALVFWILARVIQKRAHASGRVYVYGDDLIVPSKLAELLFKKFPDYGLKFNEDKCFIKGYFRESCGMDAYKGFVCTPVRMKRLFPQSGSDVTAFISCVEFSNNLFRKGYWKSAAYVQSICENTRHIGLLQRVNAPSKGLAYESFTVKVPTIDSSVRVRWNKDHQSSEIRSSFLICKNRKANYSPFGRLFANLMNQFSTVIAAPSSAKIIRRWVTLY